MENGSFWRTKRGVKEPRMMSIVAKGSYSKKRLHKKKPLFEEKEEKIPDHKDLSFLWNGKLKTHKIEEEPIAEPLKYVDDKVSLFSDFIDAEWSQKSFSTLNSVKFEIEDFERYDSGLQVLQKTEEFEKVTDSLHYWLEECDRVKGVHLFSDMDTGFSGVTEKVLEFVKEEYSKTPIFAFGFCEPSTKKETKIYDISRSICGWKNFASLIQPLTCFPPSPHLQFKMRNQFHTSFVLASAIINCTSPYRTNFNNLHPYDFSNSLVLSDKMKVISSSMCVPFPPEPVSPQKLFISSGFSFAQDLFVLASTKEDVQRTHSQHIVVRGYEDSHSHLLSKDFPLSFEKMEKKFTALYDAKSLEKMLEFYCNNNTLSGSSKWFVISA